MRNRCLTALASRRGMQVPTPSDLEQLGDDVGLHDAFASWARVHPPAKAARPVMGSGAWWQSARFARAAAIVLAAMLGLAAGARWLPRARAQASGDVGAPVWLRVTDSTIGRVNERLLAMASSDMRLTTRLTAAEIAAVMFASRRMRMLPADSLEARIDSVIHVRGRLAGGASFELAGDITLLRRGIGELRVDRLVVDGAAMPPERASQVLTRAARHDVPSSRLRFDMPAFVASLQVAGGAAEVTKRVR